MNGGVIIFKLYLTAIHYIIFIPDAYTEEVSTMPQHIDFILQRGSLRSLKLC